jgi:TolB protein
MFSWVALHLALQSAVLPVTGVRESYPDLSPDGSTLAFHSNRSGRQAIWIANADGSEPRILFDDPAVGTDPGTPDWSPDGRRIAFAMTPLGATHENESEIYVIERDGSGLTRLTDAPGDDSHPRWSASGRVYFNSARATPDLAAPWSRQWIDIYSMAADGSGIRRHTDCRSVCTYPAPSPDERLIAYRGVVDTLALNWDLSPGQRNSEVLVIPAEGGDPVNVSNDPAFDGWPTWSVDGRWVLFASNRARVARTGQIYAVRPDGTGLRALTDGPLSHVQPSASPDGRRVLVNRNSEGPNHEFGQIAAFDLSLGE